jgi:serine protease Do
LINRHWARTLSAFVIIGIFLTCAPLGSGQESETEQITRLKKAVVIVTTYDDRGKPLLQGSGFFIDSGQVATNFHVIKNASQIRVETFNRTTSVVKSILAIDEKSDLALMQVDSPSPQPTILPMKATAPAEGESVTVISNPQGYHWKVTRGSIGLLWEFHGFGERLQISAAIAPGSSGGPVLNANGEVIGIAAMYFNSVEDLNFAVPVERLQALQLKAQTQAQAREGGRRVEPRVKRSEIPGTMAKNAPEPAKRASHNISN